MHTENLVQFSSANESSVEKARNAGRKGGKISQAKQKEKKEFQYYTDIFLESFAKGKNTQEALEEKGFKQKDMTGYARIVAGLADSAFKGNHAAAKQILDFHLNGTERELVRKEEDSKSERDYKTEKLKNENLKLELETKKLELMIEAAKKGIIDKDSLPTFVLDYKD